MGDVEAHGVQANVNETLAEDAVDEVEGHGIQVNVNETTAADDADDGDEVEGHGWNNVNETVVDDDDTNR